MCWIGRRKGRLGGNPGSVHKSEGDLPSAIETGGGGSIGRKNLIAVLTGSARAGRRSSQPTAPWKSRSLPSGLPTPDAASIARRADPQKVELPQWIKVDSHLCYLSKSSGRMMEVVVEMISHVKREVEITFVEDNKIWKVIPFSTIASDANPLLGPWSTGSSSESKSTTFQESQQTELESKEDKGKEGTEEEGAAGRAAAAPHQQAAAGVAPALRAGKTVGQLASTRGSLTALGRGRSRSRSREVAPFHPKR
mmetsp:Transcript_9240/g.21663  ORF Transcript_9240/g.21663 Transcript_9240/m.21663 type:complete len:252 (+) Transcript_9240:103-858(+)